ncbi:MAG: hypothetical protein K2N92_02440, partial [Malacoplasma sp.]|nr:hypothetical protein [Malacoplasma sp.]
DYIGRGRGLARGKRDNEDEFVKKNETIITVYASSEIDEQILNKIKENIEISDKKIDLNKTILKVSK